MKNNNVYGKLMIFGIAIAFILTAVIPTINASEKIYAEIKPDFEVTDKDYTHTVFAEEASATTCGYCPTVVTIMDNIYMSGQRDFYYVTLVGNKNSYANGRIGELGVTGYPTVVYDGGYTRLIGASHTQTDHEDAIDTCGARTVANVDLDMTASWLGGGEILVNIDVTNNGGSEYNGHLHVYVTEIDSRWNVYGTQYHFAMINDYAINQNVDVGAGSTEHLSSTWSGYTDISMSNIKVIASVFSLSTMHTDETAAADPEYPNTDPPTEPSQPNGPSNGFVGISYSYSTSATEPNGDNIRYGWDWDGDDTVDDWTGYHSSGSTVNADHSFPSVGNYGIKVKAEDEFGQQSGFSPVKSVSISVGDAPNVPSAPSGETDGIHKTTYSYSASTTDPNSGDRVYYLFDWDDGTDSGWRGPYDSGVAGSASKNWNSPGTYDVKVKAKDLAGSESDWSSTTTVNMGNTPPSTPNRPSGKMDGIVGKSYSYSSYASDPEGDSIQYLFDWGDGTDSGWTSVNQASHTWFDEGKFDIKVKAKDNWDESGWSDILRITIASGTLIVDAGGPYEGIVGESIRFSGSVEGGSEPYEWLWSFGDEQTSDGQNPLHSFTDAGTFSVYLTVTDDEGSHGIGNTTATIILSHPPDTPTITGPATGKPNKEYTFTISSSDIDGDDLYYYVEWGDGNFSEWIGPYASDDEVNVSHTWTTENNFTIRVKAKDTHDFESDWATLEVSMPKNKAIDINSLFLRFLENHPNLFPILRYILRL